MHKKFPLSLEWFVRTWKVTAAVVLPPSVVVSSMRCICVIPALGQLTFWFPHAERAARVSQCVYKREMECGWMHVAEKTESTLCVSLWQRREVVEKAAHGVTEGLAAWQRSTRHGGCPKGPWTNGGRKICRGAKLAYVCVCVCVHIYIWCKRYSVTKKLLSFQNKSNHWNQSYCLFRSALGRGLILALW